MTLGLNCVHQGDCVELLRRVDDGTVDLAFADPPFNIGYEYDVYDDRRSCDDYLAFSRDWMVEVTRVLKPDGTFWLAIGDEYAAELKVLAKELGLTCRSWVIWYYTFGVNCVRGFSRSHTHLFHFVKDPKRFTFNGDNPAVRVASARQLVYADVRANPKGRLPDNTWILRPQDASPPGFAPSHDTWCFSRVAGTFKEREGFHGCQMPEQLLGRIIRISSDPGDVVLDPFAGSGTTLVVAKKLARRFVGTELSEEYAERVRERLENTRAGDPLDGPENPAASAPKTADGKRRTPFRGGRPALQLDKPTIRGLVEAYADASRGYSADYVLCDPEVNGDFRDECRRSRLPGTPSHWNRALLGLRKTGRLPAAGRRFQLSAADMDAFAAASEVALKLLSIDYGMTLDDILCFSEAASEFDATAERFAPGFRVLDYRWAALATRKRARLAKRLAVEHAALLDEPDPPRQRLDERLRDREGTGGVYELFDAWGPLYVGQTRNLGARFAGLAAEGWQSFAPTEVRIWELSEPETRAALQSLLIGRDDPLLNTELLRPETAA